MPTPSTHKSLARSLVAALVLAGVAVLGAPAPVSALPTASLVNATTDNYKAAFNADPATKENRTSLIFDAVTIDGVSYVVDQAKAPGDAQGSPAPICPAAEPGGRCHPSDGPGLPLKNASTGISDSYLVISPVPDSEQGCCARANYRVFSGGGFGPWIAVNATRFPTHPVELALSVVRGGVTVATNTLTYAYDPALAAMPRSSLEYNGPAGRWSAAASPTPLNWPSSLTVSTLRVTPGTATNLTVAPVDNSGLTVPRYADPIALAWNPAGAGRPTTAPGIGARTISVNLPAGTYALNASSSCGQQCAPAGQATVTAAAAQTTTEAKVVSPVLTMQPLDAPPAAATAGASLKALRGEVESFQVVVRGSDGGGLTGVDVVPGPLTGPGGATIPVGDVSVFAEQYTRIWTPSDQESTDQNGTGTPTTVPSQKGWCRFFPAGANNGCGIPTDYVTDGTPFNNTWHCGGQVVPVVDVRQCLFPDALVPRTDAFFGEERNAFPFDVPAGENRTVWVDVVVPAGATPGTYSGQLQVTRTGGAVVNVPLSLVVSPVVLPAVGSNPELELSAGVRGSLGNFCAAMGCTGATQDATARIYSLFVRSALENRLPLTTPAVYRPGAGAGRDAFDKWLKPFFAGSGPTNAIDGVRPPRLPATQRLVLLDKNADAADWTAWADALGGAGAQGAMRYYCDEISKTDPSDFDTNCQGPYQTKAAPSWPAAAGPLKTFLVGDQDYWNFVRTRGSAASNSDTLVPNTYFLHLRGGTNKRPTYDAAPNGYLTTAGHRLWGYDSNNAHGGPAGPNKPYWSISPAYNGYPNVAAVDQPATSQRGIGLMAWAYRLSGYFYYDAFVSFADAWNDCSTAPKCLYNQFAGHGDGTLYYPGTASRLQKAGGPAVDPIPIESMRLKRFRDGSEDYSLLRLLETGCQGQCTARSRAQLLQIVGGPDAGGAGAMPEMSRTSIGSDAYDSVRSQLLGLISPVSPPPPTQPGRIAFTSSRDGDPEIFTMAADGSDVRQLTTNAVTDDFAAWSPDGLEIAFTRGPDVWVMNADGTGQVNLTNNAAADKASKPAWSADGSKIVYVQRSSVETHTDLYKMNADGSAPTALVTYASGGIDSYDPAVSPSDVVYFSQSNGTGASLHKINLNGSGFGNVTSGSTDEVVDVAPDGTRLSFSRLNAAGTAYDVYTSDLTGGSLVNVTATAAGGAAGSDLQSSFSPASTQLAFASKPSAGAQLDIWIAGTDGTGATRLTTNTVNDSSPDWGPGTTAPATPPGPVTVTSTTTSAGAATVAFSPPATNGSPITSYQAACAGTDGGVTATRTGTSTPITVTGLTGAKSYRCRVRATNAAGTGPYGAYGPTVPIPAPTAPGPVSITSTTPKPGAATVAFNPAAANGAPITSYLAACWSTDGGVTATRTGTTTPITVTGLTGAKSYRCRVRATNAAGTGPYGAYGLTVPIPAAAQ